MLDREAIQELAQSEAIAAAQVAVDAALGDGKTHGIAALPEHWLIHDLEERLPLRRRARGTMSTARLVDFAAYVDALRQDGAAAFVQSFTFER